jgi:cytochrome b
MNRVLIWDLPTRLFHWLLAAGFGFAAFVALAIGDDSPLFPYHAIIGLVLGLMIVLRMVWGFLGSRYARFGSFAFGPAVVARYVRGAITGGGQRYVGHNPGSAYIVLAMLAVLLGLTTTGVMLGRGNEGVEDVHEVLVYTMIALAGIHLAGILLHTLRHRENIAASMVHGRKSVPGPVGIGSSHRLVAGLFVLINAAWAAALIASYDPAARTATVPALGTSLQIGDVEEGMEHQRGEHPQDHDHD